MDWTLFFAATAGASATLLGLLFVAIQLHLDAVAGDRRSRWRALARSTFDHYSSLFVLSVLMLIPGANGQPYGIVVSLVALISLGRLLLAWVPVWRQAFRTRQERLVEVVWMVLSPCAAYTFMAYLGNLAMTRGTSPNVQLGVAYCVIGLFGIVLRNSWRLAVEVGAEKKIE